MTQTMTHPDTRYQDPSPVVSGILYTLAPLLPGRVRWEDTGAGAWCVTITLPDGGIRVGDTGGALGMSVRREGVEYTRTLTPAGAVRAIMAEVER